MVMCAQVYNWTETAMVNAASLNLLKVARTWSTLYFHEHKSGISDLKWDPFKTAFLDCFHREMTVADKQVLINKLKQRPDEKIDDFVDCINLTLGDIGWDMVILLIISYREPTLNLKGSSNRIKIWRQSSSI